MIINTKPHHFRPKLKKIEDQIKMPELQTKITELQV